MRAGLTLLAVIILAAFAWPTISSAMPAQTPIYDITPAAAVGSPPHGWSVFATVRGRSMDARSMSPDWVNDPYAGAGDVQVGLGWRKAGFSTVLGYQQVDFGRRYDVRPGQDSTDQTKVRENTSSVIGLGFSFHTR
jgi:hypothetical protein